ncbi:hypothetical protein ACFQ60_37140 [Streptomyces zhihengii]
MGKLDPHVAGLLLVGHLRADGEDTLEIVLDGATGRVFTLYLFEDSPQLLEALPWRRRSARWPASSRRRTTSRHGAGASPHWRAGRGRTRWRRPGACCWPPSTTPTGTARTGARPVRGTSGSTPCPRTGGSRPPSGRSG